MKDTIPTPQPDRCIACTTCTVSCPVAERTPEYLGPRMIGPAYERFRLVGIGEDDSLHYCSNCKNCDISCPCNVPISTFIMRARAEVARKKRFNLRDWFLAHGEQIASWLRFFPASLKNFGMNFSLMRMFLHRLGIEARAPLPSFAAKSFHAQFKQYRQPEGLTREVAFFPGCYVDIYDPECGLDIVAVLNRAGWRVSLPKDFACCGLPMIANGFWDDAAKNAKRNMEALARCQASGLRVITGCPSCALMFKDDYAEYFPELLPRQFSPVLEDVCEFLQEAIRLGDLPLPPLDGKAQTDTYQTVLYHAPCHLRAQGMGLPGLDLLRAVPGLNVENADAGCCGISGSYGFKREKYEISMQVGAALFERIRSSRADICASECGTCRVQMIHGAGKPSLHPVTVLRRKLRI